MQSRLCVCTYVTQVWCISCKDCKDLYIRTHVFFVVVIIKILQYVKALPRVLYVI